MPEANAKAPEAPKPPAATAPARAPEAPKPAPAHAAAPDATALMMKEVAQTMRAIREDGRSAPVMPTEGLFRAPVPGGLYKVDGDLVNAQGEPVDDEGNVRPEG